MTKNGGVTFLHAAQLMEFSFVSHAFCTRRGGVSEGAFASMNMMANREEEEPRVRENWGILSRSFQIPESSFLLLDQVHRDDVLVIREDSLPERGAPAPAFDACVTRLPGVALCIRTADCVPVLLLDPTRRVIGAVHAGWGGTALQITAKVIDVMAREFGCRPSEILAAVGPSIGPCCYEVDERVYRAMNDHPGAERFFSAAGSPGKWHLDLPLANRCQLLERGVRGENIEASGCSTSCREELFFSHRRDRGKTGRQVSWIMLA